MVTSQNEMQIVNNNKNGITIKILEEKTGNTLFELGHSNILQDTSMKARETKAKMNYWDFIKIHIFFVSQFFITDSQDTLSLVE